MVVEPINVMLEWEIAGGRYKQILLLSVFFSRIMKVNEVKFKIAKVKGVQTII
jgi:hypothetical protein